MNYFEDAKTIEEARTLYKKLSMENHPDRGGETETMQEINNQFDFFLSNFIEIKVNEYNETTDFADIDSQPFSDILKKIIHFNIDIEIIGHWIYAFNSFKEKDELSKLGFWFSRKHKAWIYSGTKKIYVRSKNTTSDNRDKWGSESVRNKDEDQKQISA